MTVHKHLESGQSSAPAPDLIHPQPLQGTLDFID